MSEQLQNTAAIYCRLSRDDGKEESDSIVSQRLMLEKFAKDNDFEVVNEYIDDGISGTTFDRPGFKKMIKGAQSNEFKIIICKDLSRLGRDNAWVAYYTEHYFPDNDIRFIAVSDGIDTFKGENEIMPFKSVINEFYARDISKKVKSAMQIRAANGEYIISAAPYGYQKDPENIHKLIIDPMAAEIVKRIFHMAASGDSANRIAHELTRERVYSPSDYKKIKASGRASVASDDNSIKEWNQNTVFYIIRNRAYLGHYIYNKSARKSFKSKKRKNNDQADWLVIKDLFEPIIDENTFEKAQRNVAIKKRKPRKGNNIFIGMLKCADCGCRLSYASDGGSGKPAYYCNAYRTRIKNPCSAHYISYSKLYQAVLSNIRFNAENAFGISGASDDLLDKAKYFSNKRVNDSELKLRNELNDLNRRNEEIKTVLKKLLEKNAFAEITDEEYKDLSKDYRDEQNEILKSIQDKTRIISDKKQRHKNERLFLSTVQKYVDIKELNEDILRDLIDVIYVHEASGRGKKREQIIDIEYRFIGPFRHEAKSSQ